MPNIPISSLPLTTSVCANGLVPIVQNGVTFSTYSCLLGSGGSGGGSINCIIAGSGAAISPSSGIGNVTICSTTGGGGVDCVIAGSDISWHSKTPYPGIIKLYNLFYNKLPQVSCYSTVLSATPGCLKNSKIIIIIQSFLKII